MTDIHGNIWRYGTEMRLTNLVDHTLSFPTPPVPREERVLVAVLNVGEESELTDRGAKRGWISDQLRVASGTRLRKWGSSSTPSLRRVTRRGARTPKGLFWRRPLAFPRSSLEL